MQSPEFQEAPDQVESPATMTDEEFSELFPEEGDPIAELYNRG